MSGLAHIIAPAIVMIAGVPVPVDAITAAPKIIQDISGHKGPKVLARDVLPIVAAVVGIANPPVGLGLSIAFAIVVNGKPMTPEDERRWMARQGMVEY